MKTTPEQVIALINTLDELNDFFKGNSNRVALWMTTQNPMLGEIEPINFFLIGRGHKVFNFVHNAIAENKME